MKLLCINDFFTDFQKIQAQNLPEVGEVYTVCESRLFTNGELGYQFEELENAPILNNLPIFFKSTRFIDLSNIEILENEYANITINS